MRKEEVLAYLVMENTFEPSKVENLEVKKDNDLFYLRFSTKLQGFNTKNRNGRTYVGGCMVDSLKAEHIGELIEKKSWFGEAGHPLSEDVKRVLTIEPKCLSHKIVSITPNTEGVHGVIETLDDSGGYGTRMTKLILQGMEPAFSLRALAPLTKKSNGEMVMQSKAHIVTYDWVILPSHKDAYRDMTKPIDRIQQKVNPSTVQESGLLIPVEENALKSFIKEESKNIKLVSNVCEVCSDISTFSKDFKYAILKEGNKTFHVKLEYKINHDIKNFLSKL